MGRGKSFICSKCGKKYHVCPGTCLLFPEVYREILQAIKEGKYGDDWRRLTLSKELVAVDAEHYIFMCKKCGHWKVDSGLSLYAPNDAKKLKKKKYGEKTVEQWGKVPFATVNDLQKDYHLLKRYIHKCDKCGGVTHKVTKKEANSLPCPECGGAPDPSNISTFYWD